MTDYTYFQHPLEAAAENPLEHATKIRSLMISEVSISGVQSGRSCKRKMSLLRGAPLPLDGVQGLRGCGLLQHQDT